METKLILLVDIDCVCRDILPKMAEIYNRHFDDAIYPIKNYGMRENFPSLKNPSDWFFRCYLRAKEIFQESDIFPGCKEGLAKLSEYYEIKFVSHQYRQNRQFTRYWLAKHGLRYPVYFVEKKYLVPGDILVDDHITNLVEFTNAGGFSVCFAAEHNNEWDGVRVSNWQELTDELIRYGEIKAQIDRDSLEKVEEKADKLIEMVKEIDLTLTDKSKKKIRKKKERDVESENENRD